MGIDSEILETASVEASNLIAELGNGSVVRDKLEVRTKVNSVQIKLDGIKTNKILGIHLSNEEISAILSNLGCEIKQENETLIVKIPSYRMDLARDVDLIEEIGRIFGYNNLPSKYVIRGNKTGGIESISAEYSNLRNFFTGLGFIECYTASFCDETIAKEFADDNIVQIPTPLNERYTVLRPTILATLLESVKINYSRGNKDLRLFEIGKIFSRIHEPLETIHITALILGQNLPTFWQKAQMSEIDFFDIKGITESFFGYLKIKDIAFAKADIKFLNSHKAMQIKYADQNIGCIGEIKKTILDRFDIPVVVYALEIDLETIIKLFPSYRYFQPLPRFPSIIRDFAFIVDDNISTVGLTEAIKKITGVLLEQVEVFDYFKGKQLPKGKCNLGVRISLRSEERTLSQTEVNKIFERILHILKEKWHVELRG
jgi:phenylalanyl-tRNA synthetase beta chain